MIKINLANKSLSAVGAASAEMVMSVNSQGEFMMSKEDLQKQAFLRLFVMLMLPLGIYGYEEYALIPDLKAQSSELQRQKDELAVYNQKKEPAVKEIKKYEEERAKIQKKIQFLNNLAKQRSREISLHQFFQNKIPAKMWFKSYIYDQNENTIKIVGRTYEGSEIQELRNSIISNFWFKSAEIVRQNNIVDSGLPAIEFEMSIALEKHDESTSQ